MDRPRLAVLNDCHIGTIRSAGTTPRSALALRQRLLDEFREQLHGIDCALLINGDLFDKEVIPLTDLLATFDLLREWLDKGHMLYLSPGNHDLSKTSSTFSSFQFLGMLLRSVRGSMVQYITDLTEIMDGYWVLPHLANQDLLNDRLAKVPKCNVLFVHTNYDNNFAAQSDQSLNISKEQAQACQADYIVFGHEHQTRTALGGKVVIPGNQMASSVADCLNCTDDLKFRVVVEDGKPELVPVGPVPFVEMDWQAMQPTEAAFIRVAGKASPDQGAEVAQVISRYRASSPALVITNAVQILSSDDKLDQFAESLETVQAFDVLAALLELLSAEEGTAVKELLNA